MNSQSSVFMAIKEKLANEWSCGKICVPLWLFGFHEYPFLTVKGTLAHSCLWDIPMSLFTNTEIYSSRAFWNENLGKFYFPWCHKLMYAVSGWAITSRWGIFLHSSRGTHVLLTLVRLQIYTTHPKMAGTVWQERQERIRTCNLHPRRWEKTLLDKSLNISSN